MKNGRKSQGSHGRSLVTLAITRAVKQEEVYRVDQKPQNTSSVPEEITGVPKELASEASKEEEGALKEVIGGVVLPPFAARMTRA